MNIDFDKVRAELDAEITAQNIVDGKVDMMVKYNILSLAEAVGGLIHLGATPEFINSVVAEAIVGGQRVKDALGI